ncbi:MAG: hypothetical protein WA191_15070 [Telluria sp.]
MKFNSKNGMLHLDEPSEFAIYRGRTRQSLLKEFHNFERKWEKKIDQQTEIFLSPGKLKDRQVSLDLFFLYDALERVAFYWVDGQFSKYSTDWDSIVEHWDLAEKDHMDTIDWLTELLEREPDEIMSIGAKWIYPWGSVDTWCETRSFTTGWSILWASQI